MLQSWAEVTRCLFWACAGLCTEMHQVKSEVPGFWGVFLHLQAPTRKKKRWCLCHLIQGCLDVYPWFFTIGQLLNSHSPRIAPIPVFSGRLASWQLTFAQLPAPHSKRSLLQHRLKIREASCSLLRWHHPVHSSWHPAYFHFLMSFANC